MPLHRHLSPPTSRPTFPLLVHRWEGGPIPPLTQREREVLALLAGGPSNRQIAEALGISERTAEAHVANILGKTGLTSRGQVIAWAARRER